MKTIQLIPLLLFTTSLVAAAERRPTTHQQSTETSLASTAFAQWNAPIQRMDNTSSFVGSMYRTPVSTACCATGVTVGIAATGIKVCASPATIVSLGTTLPACYSVSAFLCCMGLCDTPPVKRVRDALRSSDGSYFFA